MKFGFINERLLFNKIIKDEEIQKKVNAFVRYITRFDLIDITIKIIEEKLKTLNFNNKLEQETLSDILSYAQSIFAGNPISNKTPRKPNLRKIRRKFLQVFLWSTYHNVQSLSGYDCRVSPQFASRLHEISFSDCYPKIYIDIISKLLQHQEDLLQQTYGISVEDVTKGLSNILETFHDIVVRFIPKQKIMKEKFLVKSVTNWPDDFIKDLEYKCGEASYYSTREKYPNWFKIEAPINKKPFINIRGESYFTSIATTFDCIYRAIQKSLCEKDSHNIDKWQQNQQLSTENYAIELLQKILPSCETFKNNFYNVGKHWYENDGLIVYQNTLFVIEVKSGSFSPKSILIDENSHIISKQNLMYKANKQAVNLIDNLKENIELKIYDEFHKNLKTVLNFKNFKRIIPVIVTIDSIAEILLLDNNGANAYFICITDLALLSYIFESEPALFIYYVLQRIGFEANEFMITDELDYVTSFQKNRFFLDELRGNKELCGIVSPQVEREELDKYFAFYPKSPRPSFDIPEVSVEFVKCLETDVTKQKLEFLLMLLDNGNEIIEKVNKSLHNILQKQIKYKMFSSIVIHSVNMPNFIPTMLFVNTQERQYISETEIKRQTLAALKKYNFSKIYSVLAILDGKKIISVDVCYYTKESLTQISKEELDIALQSFSLDSHNYFRVD